MTKKKGLTLRQRLAEKGGRQRMSCFAPFRSILAAACFGAMLATAAAAPEAPAKSVPAAQRGPSGLPLPRFVSLKSSRVNMRVGPGLTYAVDWLYLKSGLPMEIVQEYDNWRRVRDADGAEGWINQALLSGRRTGIAAPWFKGKEASVALRNAPEDGARMVANVEPGAIGTIYACNGDWCQMDFDGYRGWIDQSLVWGAYPGEAIKQ